MGDYRWTFEDIMRMVYLHTSGKSYTEIGRKFGITRQRVHQIIGNCCGKQGHRYIAKEECIYPNIRVWMNSNGIRFTRLCEYLGHSNRTYSTMRHKLLGESNFSIVEIKELIKLTGLPFEELFKTDEELPEKDLSNFDDDMTWDYYDNVIGSVIEI